MRIACLQFNPQVGDVDNNLTRADRVLSKANPDNIDLLVLPEMAFSGKEARGRCRQGRGLMLTRPPCDPGYNFKSLRTIHQYLEPTRAGISSLWARTTALKYNCHVLVGYPEKADVTHKWPTSPEYFNSVIVVGPEGDNVAHYRKTHLYYTDETWALEGPDDFFGDHVTGLGQVAMGICMDIKSVEAQFGINYEGPANVPTARTGFRRRGTRSSLATTSCESTRIWSSSPWHGSRPRTAAPSPASPRNPTSTR
jgi:protein N-terminal amidase